MVPEMSWKPFQNSVEIPRNLPGNSPETYWTFAGNSLSTFRGNVQEIPWTLPGNILGTSWKLPGNIKQIPQKLPFNSPEMSRKFSGHFPENSQKCPWNLPEIYWKISRFVPDTSQKNSMKFPTNFLTKHWPTPHGTALLGPGRLDKYSRRQTGGRSACSPWSLSSLHWSSLLRKGLTRNKTLDLLNVRVFPMCSWISLDLFSISLIKNKKIQTRCSWAAFCVRVCVCVFSCGLCSRECPPWPLSSVDIVKC